jgi:hypothetical protein
VGPHRGSIVKISRSKLFILGICMDSCDLLYVLNPYEQVREKRAREHQILRFVIFTYYRSYLASSWTAVTCYLCLIRMKRCLKNADWLVDCLTD